MEEIKTILIEHREEFRQKYSVHRIGIFGSRARQDDTAISDVDLLVELIPPVGWEIVDLQRYLEQLLQLDVDLVTKGAVMHKPLLWQSIQEDLIYV